jgi:hypothetical protein
MHVKTVTPSWTCDRCAVNIRWMAGQEREAPPAGWSVGKSGTHCLSCRRALAAEAACATADAGSTREDRAKLRNQALIEFEVRRAPERPNGEIAKALSCSVPAVVKARQRLEAAGLVEAIAPRP